MSIERKAFTKASAANKKASAAETIRQLHELIDRLESQLRIKRARKALQELGSKPAKKLGKPPAKPATKKPPGGPG